jgi:hypothetical protein
MAATKEMVLGTLAHRAILWPFIEPAYGSRLTRMKNDQVFSEIVRRNVLVLTRAYRSQNMDSNDPLITPDVVSALVDRTGGATSHAADPMKQLSMTERSWALQKLPGVCLTAAHALAEDIRSRNYITLRSEVPTQDLDWEPPVFGSPRLQQRLDLVGLARDGVLEIIELKVTSRRGRPDVDDFPQVRAQLEAVRARLGERERPLRGRLLYVHTEGMHRWATFADEREHTANATAPSSS